MTRPLIYFSAVLLMVSLLSAADVKKSTQVMPAKRRAQIVATAKSLFEPEVKNSLKVGRVKSPFSTSAE